MSKKKYWKDVRQSFSASWGRTLSIVFLLALGATTLIGLKVVSPNMEATGQKYIEQTKMADLMVMSDYGLTKTDVQELKKVKGAQVEAVKLQDVTIKKTNQAVRIFSKSQHISQDQVVVGKLPQKANQIALAEKLRGKYHLGDKIRFDRGKNDSLKRTQFTVVGFIKSAEIWSEENLGSSSVGTGELQAYAVTTAGAFETNLYGLARVRFANLNNPYYTDTYKANLKKDQTKLKTILKNNGTERLHELQASARQKLATNQAQIRALETQISQAQALGVDVSQSQAEVAKAQAKLAVSQRQIEAMPKPTYTVYNRETLPGGNGYSTYATATSSISAVGDIFPLVLYLVAALVTLTTMTRFVDEERGNAGLFRALGYTKHQVVMKFVLYGLVTSFIGTTIGIVVGNYGLSPIIGDIVTAGTVIGASKLYFHLNYIIIAFVAALLSAVLPAYLVARRDLSEQPAHLLQAKPPVAGSKIFLERMSFVWKRFSFTQKVTARNIFRYKQRMLMTIFGVAGSVALLFAGLGIQASISGVSTSQFQEILKYNLIVVENPQATKTQKAKVATYLDRKATDRRAVQLETLEEKISGVSDKQDINLIISQPQNFAKYVNLRHRNNGQALKLNNQGVILSEKLANLYGVKTGQKINLKLAGKKRQVKVAGITEMYAAHFIYMSADYYRILTGKDYQTNASLVKLKDNRLGPAGDTAAHLLKMSAVGAVSQNNSAVQQLNKVAGSLQTVMIILIILSVLLAVVILYNLTNINVSERIRELSTIKVLGFHSKEVTLYIYRETITLSFVGIIVGLVGGFYLHKLILGVIGSDQIMFNPSVGLYVYLVPTVAIIVILFLLGLLVNRILKRVDMLEALKSVD